MCVCVCERERDRESFKSFGWKHPVNERSRQWFIIRSSRCLISTFLDNAKLTNMTSFHLKKRSFNLMYMYEGSSEIIETHAISYMVQNSIQRIYCLFGLRKSHWTGIFLVNQRIPLNEKCSKFPIKVYTLY